MPIFNNDCAMLEFRRTPWDEKIFGFPCAEIMHFRSENISDGLDVLEQFERWINQEGVCFAYGRFQANKLNKVLVQKFGFYFAEASYRIRHNKLQGSDSFDNLIRPGPILEPALPEDSELLKNILEADFEYGRIHEDPWVDAKISSLRYRYWFDDLVAQGHQIFTYRLKGEVIGLHIQRKIDDKVDLVLTGVKRSHALLGVSLWAEVFRLNRIDGVRELCTLISAANLPIVNIYRHFEFKFDSLLLGFHKRWPRP